MKPETVYESLGIVGGSAAFRRILDFVQRYAAFQAPVLIWGETGTGKELVARALHYLSPRAGRPFVPVNCGALPDALFENELFGHSRGAYTDARTAQKGLVAQAHGGTLLLDELDSLTPRAQVALLRFLQDQMYRPLGSDAPVEADVRVIAATNADLSALVRDGGFRSDLLFRLDVATVVMPPLRQRTDDILPLASYFLNRFAARYGTERPVLGKMIEMALLRHDWPGNVRELENAMHRAVILSDGARLDRLPLGVLSASSGSRPVPPGDYAGSLKTARARCLEAFERQYVQRLLRDCGGNVSAAARSAGTERRHLGRLIRRLGVQPSEFHNPD